MSDRVVLGEAVEDDFAPQSIDALVEVLTSEFLRPELTLA